MRPGRRMGRRWRHRGHWPRRGRRSCGMPSRRRKCSPTHCRPGQQRSGLQNNRRGRGGGHLGVGGSSRSARVVDCQSDRVGSRSRVRVAGGESSTGLPAAKRPGVAERIPLGVAAGPSMEADCKFVGGGAECRRWCLVHRRRARRQLEAGRVTAAPAICQRGRVCVRARIGVARRDTTCAGAVTKGPGVTQAVAVSRCLPRH
jgi:hypothetical protein